MCLHAGPPAANPRFALMPGEIGSHQHLSDAVPWKPPQSSSLPDFLPDVPAYTATFTTTPSSASLSGRMLGATPQDARFDSLDPYHWGFDSTSSTTAFDLPYAGLAGSMVHDANAVSAWGHLLAIGGSTGKGGHNGCVAVYGMPRLVQEGEQPSEVCILLHDSCQAGLCAIRCRHHRPATQACKCCW